MFAYCFRLLFCDLKCLLWEPYWDCWVFASEFIVFEILFVIFC